MKSSVRVTPQGQAPIEKMEETVAHGLADESITGDTKSAAGMQADPATCGATEAPTWETSLGSSMMTSKGQITVPAEVRERHGFEPGERVVFRELNGRVIVEPATASVERLYGMLAHLAVGRPPATIEEMEEAAAAGWAREPIEPR